MLLKLQKYSSRINFHQGLLEKEEITYKHQRRRLKSLPLETPTEIELEPGNTIRVTLFDANHCPGAVMFREPYHRPLTPLNAHAHGPLDISHANPA